jgi:hypothetical protein
MFSSHKIFNSRRSTLNFDFFKKKLKPYKICVVAEFYFGEIAYF